MPAPEVSSCSPQFSVIIPVYNQWDLAPSCLDAIVKQVDRPASVEIMVVDNGSDAVPCLEETKVATRLLRCSTPGSYASRNFGASHARGEWLLFTDADCIPDAEWLSEFSKAIERQVMEDYFLAGNVQMFARSKKPNSSEIYDLVKGIPQARYVTRGYAATANLAVPRRLFEAHGGFDGRRFSGGDAEFCRRLRAAGCNLLFVPTAIVRHPARSDVSALVSKARRVKGGQIGHGQMKTKAYWALRTFCPPVVDWTRFLRQRSLPLRYRLVACAVHLRLWLVEMSEVLRLIAGARPERR